MILTQEMEHDEVPVVTCAGNQGFFSKIHPSVVESLSREACSWQRTYGRPVKKVKLKAQFVPYDVHQLPRQYSEIRLFKDPVLHIFWVDCNSEGYKKSVRDDVFMWLSSLRALNIIDWIIVVVVHDESKVKNKILRSSVYDKVKSEFASRNSSRCVLFSEPLRNNKSSESWRSVISRLQQSLLDSLSRLLTRYEDHIRMERERRNLEDWTFSKYLLLQEQLALFYTCLEMYEDALVQYDELDALFAQFVVNHSVGAKCEWLLPYAQLTTGWEGVTLRLEVNMYRRMLISENKPSVLDLRNYLFSQQCKLLVNLNQPDDLCSRALKFIHNTMHELRLLEVVMPEGAVSCWMFLTCKELISVCEQFKFILGMELYSTYTSSIWSCMQSVTYKLGTLCGLMPGSKTSSTTLHSVVQLISGFGSINNPSATGDEPQERLRSMLSSSTEFCKHYVELTELTMGTLKYIGHGRRAKLLGLQLARFYLDSNQPAHAESFILGAIQSFASEKWTRLEVDSWQLLARCEMMLEQYAVYLRACLRVCCEPRSPHSLRMEYLTNIAQLDASDNVRLVIQEEKALSLHEFTADYSCASQQVNVELNFTSHLPAAVTIKSISFNVKHTVPSFERKAESVSSGSIDTRHLLTVNRQFSSEGRLRMIGLDCINTHKLIKQKDSQGNAKMLRNLSKNSFDQPEESDQVVTISEELAIQPGSNNKYNTPFKVTSGGWFTINQVKVSLNKFDMLLSVAQSPYSRFYVMDKPPPTVTLEADTYYQGVWNIVNLTIYSTEEISQQPELEPLSHLIIENLEFLKGVRVQSDQFKHKLTFKARTNPTLVNSKPLNSPVLIKICDTEDERPHVFRKELEFLCPLELISRLRTSNERKYIEVCVFAIVPNAVFEVQQESITLADEALGEHLSITPSVKSSGSLPLLKDCEIVYLWDLETSVSDTVKLHFSLEFTPGDSNTTEIRDDSCDISVKPTHYLFQTNFTLNIVQTLYVMRRYLKPGFPTSPLTLSRRSSQSSLLSPGSLDSQSNPFKLVNGDASPKRWQTACQCDMVVELTAQAEEMEDWEDCVSYEVVGDHCWAVSDNKKGTISMEAQSGTVTVSLLPLTDGVLYLPSVKLLTKELEEFLPGQVYDFSKHSQVVVTPLDEAT